MKRSFMNFSDLTFPPRELEPASQKSDLLLNRMEVIEAPDAQLTVAAMTMMMLMMLMLMLMTMMMVMMMMN